jgi:hypothetical protein
MTFDENGMKPQAHKFPKAKVPPDKKPSVFFPSGPRPHGDQIGLDEDIRVHHAEEMDPEDGQTS